MLTIKFSRSAGKFQQHLPPKHRRQIALKIVQLRTIPVPQDSQKLTGFPYRRVDIGEYRIIYKANGDELYIYRIGKRNDAEVYRNLR